MSDGPLAQGGDWDTSLGSRPSISEVAAWLRRAADQRDADLSPSPDQGALPDGPDVAERPDEEARTAPPPGPPGDDPEPERDRDAYGPAGAAPGPPSGVADPSPGLPPDAAPTDDVPVDGTEAPDEAPAAGALAEAKPAVRSLPDAGDDHQADDHQADDHQADDHQADDHQALAAAAPTTEVPHSEETEVVETAASAGYGAVDEMPQAAAEAQVDVATVPAGGGGDAVAPGLDEPGLDEVVQPAHAEAAGHPDDATGPDEANPAEALPAAESPDPEADEHPLGAAEVTEPAGEPEGLMASARGSSSAPLFDLDLAELAARARAGGEEPPPLPVPSPSVGTESVEAQSASRATAGEDAPGQAASFDEADPDGESVGDDHGLVAGDVQMDDQTAEEAAPKERTAGTVAAGAVAALLRKRGTRQRYPRGQLKERIGILRRVRAMLGVVVLTVILGVAAGAAIGAFLVFLAFALRSAVTSS